MTPALAGFDPGTRALGWAIADLETGAPIICGHRDLDDVGRSLEKAVEWVDVLARDAGAEILIAYVEGMFSGGRNAVTGVKVTEAAGATVHAVHARWGVPIERLQPAAWKGIVGGIPRGLVGVAAKRAHKARAVELGWNPPSFDAADACLIAHAGVIANRDIIERSRDA